MSLKLLSLADIKQSITMQQAIDAMESALLQLAKQQVIMPLRTGISIENEQALSLTMPAYLAQDAILGLKVVSIFPHNLTQHKPSINGLILLLDAKTGEPQVLMDAGYLTALRTGAISGLATKYFAKEEASHLAIIGTGVQAEAQLAAVVTVRPIKHISVWSRDIKKAAHFAKKFESQYDMAVYDSVSAAVKGADVICTATSSPIPLINSQDVELHVHINAIGSHNRHMREISNELLHQAIVIVDQQVAALAEAGEIISAIEESQLEKTALIEIGQWLLNKELNYQNHLTVFKSVGLAIQDLSVAHVVYENAKHKNLGLSFTLN
jgi:ornithine cyclodeaminase